MLEDSVQVARVLALGIRFARAVRRAGNSPRVVQGEGQVDVPKTSLGVSLDLSGVVKTASDTIFNVRWRRRCAPSSVAPEVTIRF
jgi:hypothetical protein